MMRTVLSSVIGLLALALAIWSLPPLQIEPRGIFLPAGKTLQPISEQNVRFLDVPPLQFKSVGNIQITRHFSANSSDDLKTAEEQILEKARQLAAQAGANGVVVRFFAHSDADMRPTALAIYRLSGQAISIEDSHEH
jgi:hypothetical protein